FDNTQNQSTNPGVISPAKISISGGQHYQNNFLIDGVNFNNDLDPAYENFATNPNQLANKASGRSQGFALDTDLLDSITVIDSNAGAEYGGFTGGVIDAKTKKPTKDFGLKISYGYTNGNAAKGWPHSLTHYYLDDKDDYLTRTGTGNDIYRYYDTPEFEKHKIKLVAEGKINDKLSFVSQINKNISYMPIQVNSFNPYNSKGYTAITPYDSVEKLNEKRKRKEEQLNIFTKVFYDFSDALRFALSYTYAPDKDWRFMTGSKNSSYSTDHGGHIASFETDWDNALGHLKSTTSYTYSQDSKTAHGYSDYYRFFMISDNAHWGREEEGTVEGGPVPSKSTQQNFSQKFVQEFEPYKFANTTHTFKTGIEFTLAKVKFKYSNANFYRENTNNAYPMTAEQQAACKASGNTLWCDPSATYDPGWLGVTRDYTHGMDIFDVVEFVNPYTGEYVGPSSYLNYVDKNGKKVVQENKMLKWKYGNYIRKVEHYDGTKQVNITDKKLGLFLEDGIDIDLASAGNLYVRPGIRYDYEDFNKEHLFSPRLFVDYSFAWNENHPEFSTHLSAGANRYYGRTLYMTAFREMMNTLNTTLHRDSPDVSWESVLNGPVCTGSESVSKDIYSSKSNLKKGKAQTLTKYYYIDANGNKNYNCRVPSEDKSYMLSKLKNPYSDELMLGFSQDIYNLNLNGKYIHRKGRNEVILSSRKVENLNEVDGYTTNYSVYTNGGKSETDIFTLNLKNIEPYRFANIDNSFNLAFTYSKTKRNKEDYTDSLSQEEADDYRVLWDGELIRWSEKPAENFNKPYSIKLSTFHEFNMLGGNWHLSNLFSWVSSYKKHAIDYSVNYTGADFNIDQDEVKSYKAFNIPSKFTWDMQVGAEYKVYKDNKLFFNIDIYNLLNKRNKTTASYSSSSKTGTITQTEVIYETGRSVWFEFGYKF
ncbi:MAG: TonB-dependent receptor plug domain-containing protein, partial [Campylobacter sp.]|nr:TonB-dependent receptor plug domain-containing protein [Campylobacter sp.]